MSESATIERLEHRIGLLTEAVTKLARIDGARLSRAEVCALQVAPQHVGPQGRIRRFPAPHPGGRLAAGGCGGVGR